MMYLNHVIKTEKSMDVYYYYFDRSKTIYADLMSIKNTDNVPFCCAPCRPYFYMSRDNHSTDWSFSTRRWMLENFKIPSYLGIVRMFRVEEEDDQITFTTTQKIHSENVEAATNILSALYPYFEGNIIQDGDTTFFTVRDHVKMDDLDTQPGEKGSHSKMNEREYTINVINILMKLMDRVDERVMKVCCSKCLKPYFEITMYNTPAYSHVDGSTSCCGVGYELIDAGMIGILGVLNSIPGLTSKYCCESHYQDCQMYVKFHVDDSVLDLFEKTYSEVMNTYGVFRLFTMDKSDETFSSNHNYFTFQTIRKLYVADVADQGFVEAKAIRLDGMKLFFDTLKLEMSKMTMEDIKE